MRRSVLLATAALIALVFLVKIAAPGPRGDRPPGARGIGGTGGNDGLVDEIDVAEEPEGSIRSPSGRLVVRGSRDALGYVLPLDVRRPRPAPDAAAEPGPERGGSPARDPVRTDGDVATGPREGSAPKTSVFTETKLSPADGHTQNETAIAMLADTLVAGWNAFTAGGLFMGVGRSTDRGATWSSGLITGHSAMSDPVVRAGGNGVWYYAYIGMGGVGGTDWEVFVRRSTDAGATWQSPVNVTNDTNFDDKPYADARGNEVLVAYGDFGFSPAKVRAAHSTDGGLTFGPHATLANVSVGGNGACPVIAPDGVNYVFWRDSFQDSIWISRSTDGGGSWSTDRGIAPMTPLPSTLPGGFRIVNLPTAAADPLTGTLVVAWNDQAFGNPDIVSVRSTDGGTTWSSPIRVNDDAGTNAQWFPWITFDEMGVLHAVWYDRRGDGTAIDVYYARSTDAGATFETNARVTPAGFTAVLPWESGAAAFIGDYNGIAAAGGDAFPFYQDSREGNQDVWVAHIPSPAVAVGGPTSGNAAPAQVGLAAAPNPFRERVTLSALGAGGASTIEIVSVEGRRIARLATDGRGEARWDGRDAEGRELPAGIYFARDAAGAGPALRLVKLR